MILLVPELETDGTRHPDARRAAERVASAIEVLACAEPKLADFQLVEMKRVVVERLAEVRDS